ncbi:MAG: putative transporter permease protein [Acidimicrobiales bacterium]|nr:putative transporter permease protein [Acidimicrobiales bacterium]
MLAANGPKSWIWWHWVRTHEARIWQLTRQHIELTMIAVVIGLAISFPLALLARRWRWLESPIVGVTGALYTIPSLAAIGLLLPLTGLSRTTAEIVLVSYTLLILVRNIVAGLDSVPPDVRDAARGMGFSPARMLVRIELPLALPAIVAGLRIATVTTIGLVTITALLGPAGGGLGQLIYDGLLRDFRTPLVVGSVLSVVLAVLADLGLVGLQRLATPWANRRPG